MDKDVLVCICIMLSEVRLKDNYHDLSRFKKSSHHIHAHKKLCAFCYILLPHATVEHIVRLIID